MTIKVLSDSLINKIAAGEVIERPANVIKELIENSIDSGADSIKIEIENAGLKKIKVVDNGEGMDRDDLLLSYKRHTTSKIYNESDLESIGSLGFRGEALASIAEVSHLKIKTKRKDNEVGNMVEVEGGILLASEKVGCPDGTVIEIQDLFYNVPARKKFLKSGEVELAHIIDIITRYALVRKEISFILINNEKEILNSQKTSDPLSNIIYIYGTEISRNLVEVSYNTKYLQIEGYVSKPNLTRANRNEQSLYVNGRYVRSPVISEAIYSAYKTFLFTNRHPIYILNLTIKPSEVDINVHPNKLDVRIKNEQEVCESFFTAVKRTLQSHVLIPVATPETETLRKPTNVYPIRDDKQSILFNDESEEDSEKEVENSPSKEFEYTINNIKSSVEDKGALEYEIPPKPERKNPFESFNILGQLNLTFIVAQSPDGLILIDQHAAEERVNFELFSKQYKNNVIKKQFLIESKIVELTPVQYQTASNNYDFLQKLGFSFEEFGGTTIKLTAIPEVFGKLNHLLLIDIINELSKISSDIIDSQIEERVIKMSCRASIKAGEELSISEMKLLLKKLGDCENPYSCPHGRPTTVLLTHADLEKKFKRTGW